jgi:hypothetical protein
MTTSQRFLDALVSSGRTRELTDVDDLFGFLIGSWDIEAVLHDPDGRTRKSRGEVHASWILEGRAIQDLFIFPRPADRAAGVPAQGDRYATTIRTYDRMLHAWRVNFINPAADETSAQLIARRLGQDISRWRANSPAACPFVGATTPSLERPSVIAPRNRGATASPGSSTWSSSGRGPIRDRG